MARDNKSLGDFVLSGIASAPRGVPQIEVTFDIDASGILHVTAKDKGTGKEQKVTIQGSTGMDDKEVDRLVKEAEANRETDKARKEAIEARNMADSGVYQAEKTLKDNEGKFDSKLGEEAKTKIDELKKILANADAEKDAISTANTALQDVMMKIGQEIYGKNGGDAGNGAPDTGKKNDDGTVDAEVEEK